MDALTHERKQINGVYGHRSAPGLIFSSRFGNERPGKCYKQTFSGLRHQLARMRSPVQIRVAAPKSYEILDNISSENGEIRAEAAQKVEQSAAPFETVPWSENKYCGRKFGLSTCVPQTNLFF